MGWKEKLQPASFRGVPFGVETGDLTIGRRGQTHEYPGRDIPYTEDLGRAARKVSIEAFLVGDDYMKRRDKLLAALERGGSGELVHPWHGRMKMDVDGECRVRHGIKEGRYCTITIGFIESGELVSPSATDAPSTQTLISADAARVAALTEFSSLFKVNGLPSFVLDDAFKSVTGTMNALENGMRNLGVINDLALAALHGDLHKLLPNSYSLANRVFSLFNKASSIVSGKSTQSGNWNNYPWNADTVNFYNTLTVTNATASFASVAASTATSPSEQQSDANKASVSVLVTGALLVQAAGMTASINLSVYDDAAQLRKQLLRALDAYCMRLQSDESFAAFSDLRSKVNLAITSQMRNAARLREYTPKETLPALVLAYDLYEQPDRDAEIIARNKIRHPGFVPANPIRVLTA
jgi:prophage DNA circulation protein